MDLPEAMREAVEQAIRSQRAAIEQACEEAIAGGQHGVLVLGMRFGGKPEDFFVGMDPSVPYGEIRYA